MMMHTLKTKLSKYQNFIDKAFEHIAQGSDEQIIEVSFTDFKFKIQYFFFSSECSTGNLI